MLDSLDVIKKQIKLGEDSIFEFKSVRFNGNQIVGPNRKSIADEIASMANTNNGIILLRIDDSTHKVTGIPNEKLDVTETWIRDICYDSIKPPINCIIRKLSIPDEQNIEKSVIRIDVPKSLFVHQSPGGYFLRIGSSKRQMSPDLLARLFQQRSQTRMIRFDEQIVPGASISNLSPSLWNRFRTVLSPKEDKEFLEKMKLVTQDESGVLHPTVSGILMTCYHPEEFLPSAFIQCILYKGLKKSAHYQIDARDVTGPLDIQIRDACLFVERNTRVYATKNPTRKETPQFSRNAVFEAITNAVAHRDYSVYGSKIRLHIFLDRIELFSPGTLPNTMSVESLSERQSSRNELICSLLARTPINYEAYGSKREFIMDQRGEGVPIIVIESEELSNRRPKYEILDDAELKLTIFAAKSPHGDNEY